MALTRRQKLLGGRMKWRLPDANGAAENGGGTMQKLVSDWEANSEDDRDTSSLAFYLSSPADEKSLWICHIRLH